ISTPCSGSIEHSSVCATAIPDSCTDFFATTDANLPERHPSNRTLARVRRVAHRVVLIPGDGTGPELAEATRRVLEETGVALKGPITTPVGGGFRSVNVALRKSLDLYGQVRPCKSYPGVRSRFEDVDLVIIRENTEDLYAGIEYEQGTTDAEELIRWIESKGGALRWNDAGISIKPI